MVLTQPRTTRTSSVSITRFHTTMVLTQPVIEVDLYNSYYSFHTTMVLTQRIKALPRFADTSKFPYHYGSYATVPG